MYHVAVLLKETLEALAVRPDGIYLDGTLGGGGHFQAVLDHLQGGTAVGIDRDPEALEWCRTNLRPGTNRVILAQARFSQFPGVFAEHHIDRVDGMLLDLGVSSHQIDSPERGFSYREQGPLDMRMGPLEPLTAARLLRESDMETISAILRELGEVRNAPRMAGVIAAAAAAGHLATTADLRSCLEREYGELQPKVLSKVFQALRIAVNHELDELQAFLALAGGHLRTGGRLVVIAYHSLEDRIVKNFMRDKEGRCVCPPEAPICTCHRSLEFKRINRSAISPAAEEIARNPRSRSARLRTAERCA
jgi:16S rRNA (cytosine1402-N4)-methyltransferase